VSLFVWHKPLNFVRQIVTQSRFTGVPYITVDDGSPFGNIFPLIVTALRYNFSSSLWQPLAIFEVTHRSGNRLDISGPIEGLSDISLRVGDVLSMNITALSITEVQDAIDWLRVNTVNDNFTGGTLLGGQGTRIPTEITVGAGLSLSGGQLSVLVGSGGGLGTVTSVALTLPGSVFSVTGSPVTGSGTLTGDLLIQAAHQVWAGPGSGPDAVPAFRHLVTGDLPDLSGVYLTSNQSITLSGVVSGSGTTTITTTIADGGITNTMLAGDITASKLTLTDITLTQNQITGLETALSSKASLNSPVFTGVPAAPTAAGGTNTTQIATTAFVLGQGFLTSVPAALVTSVANRTGDILLTTDDIGGLGTIATHSDLDFLTSNQNIVLSGVVSGSGTTAITTTIADGGITNAMLAGDITAAKLVGTDLSITEAQVINLPGDLGSKAPLASPALTGTPTAPTAGTGTNTTQIATTAFVLGQGFLTSVPAALVTSVANRTGDILLTTDDIGGLGTLAQQNVNNVAITGGILSGVNLATHRTAIVADTDAGTVTMDLSQGDARTLQTTAAVGATRTINFSNVQIGQKWTVEVIQPASGGPCVVTWDAGVRWSSGVVPTGATVANKADLYVFYCRDAGSYAGGLSLPAY
jgi:hypothetical protein